MRKVFKNVGASFLIVVKFKLQTYQFFWKLWVEFQTFQENCGCWALTTPMFTWPLLLYIFYPLIFCKRLCNIVYKPSYNFLWIFVIIPSQSDLTFWYLRRAILEFRQMSLGRKNCQGPKKGFTNMGTDFRFCEFLF